MKRQQEQNINTADYYDVFFQPPRACTKDRVLRQKEFIDLIDKSGRIIELASGMSYFCQMAKIRYPESDVWGIDFSVVAKERMAHEESGLMYPVNYVVGDALNTPFKDGCFDVVVSGEFIEHLEQPEDLIKEMVRLAKQGGLMIISTPHLETKDLEHLWEFEPEDILAMFEKYGQKAEFKLVKSDISTRYYIIVWARKK
jgi:ubiquinone/menaquinone biosynthesis C-methylase UbiE